MPSRPVPIFLRASARFFYPLRARPRCVYMPSTPPPDAPLPYSSLPPDPSPPSPQRPPRVHQGTPPRGGRPQPRHVRRRPGHLLGHRRWRPHGATVCGVRGRPGRGVAQGEGRERENTKKTESVCAWMGGCFSLFFTPPPPHFNPRVAPLSSPSSVRVGPLSSMPSPRASTARPRWPGSTRKTSCGTTGRPRRGRGCLGRPAERHPGRRGRRSTRGRPALCGSGGRTRR